MTNPYLVRTLILESGERLPVLVTSATGQPLFEPTIYSLVELRATNKATNTIAHMLRAVTVLLLFLDVKHIDLDERIRGGHARIKMAYQLTKERLRGSPRSEREHKLSDMEVRAMLERYQRLQAENERLKVENERLLEQFVTWAYHAHLKGLTKDHLNSPLPRIDRELTKPLLKPVNPRARQR